MVLIIDTDLRFYCHIVAFTKGSFYSKYINKEPKATTQKCCRAFRNRSINGCGDSSYFANWFVVVLLFQALEHVYVLRQHQYHIDHTDCHTVKDIIAHCSNARPKPHPNVNKPSYRKFLSCSNYWRFLAKNYSCVNSNMVFTAKDNFANTLCSLKTNI